MAVLRSSAYHFSRPVKPSWKIITITRTSVMFFTTSITIAILFVCSLNYTFKTLFLFRPKPPTVRLNSLSLPYFATTPTNLGAIWIANFTICNPNAAVELAMHRVESSVFYRKDSALCVTTAVDDDRLMLDFKEERLMYMKFATTGREDDRQPIVEYSLLREVEEEVRSGTVRFDVRMSIYGVYKSGWYWSKRAVIITLDCMDLDIASVGELIDGIGGGPRDCPADLLMIYDDHHA